LDQLHKRSSDEQVAFLFQAYGQGLMGREEVQETLGIGRTRFFDLWRVFRQAPEAYSISYQRAPFKRVLPEAEMVLEQELLVEKSLIDNPDLPISSYNYSAVRDRLQKQGIDISVNTVIDRAK
jgi:hypothetical protein